MRLLAPKSDANHPTVVDDSRVPKSVQTAEVAPDEIEMHLSATDDATKSEPKWHDDDALLAAGLAAGGAAGGLLAMVASGIAIVAVAPNRLEPEMALAGMLVTLAFPVVGAAVLLPFFYNGSVVGMLGSVGGAAVGSAVGGLVTGIGAGAATFFVWYLPYMAPGASPGLYALVGMGIAFFVGVGVGIVGCITGAALGAYSGSIAGERALQE